MTEKFLEYLQEAEKTIKACDHLVYVTIPLIKEKKILIKIILELKKAISCCINAVLQYEYIFKKINLYKDPRKNFNIFLKESSKRFNITQEEKDYILEIFKIVSAHKISAMEFTRREQVVILSENMQKEFINLGKIKKYLAFSKNLIKKIREKITLQM